MTSPRLSTLRASMIAIIAFAIPTPLLAARIYLSPSTAATTVGNTVTVGVYVDSTDQAMNAASGTIAIPSNIADVIGTSEVGTIFSSWVQEPTLNSTAHTIHFEGIVINPGFTGNAGKLVSITLRLKANGDASLHFLTAAVLANDGKGTNILTGTGGATLTGSLASADGVQTVTSSETGTTLRAPVLTSPTHPNSDVWYRNTQPSFHWALPAGSIGTRVSMDASPAGAPTTMYTPAIGTKTFGGLSDGIWYIHVQIRDASGWSGVSTQRIRIDTTRPDNFNIKLIPDTDPLTPFATLIFDAHDALSGIDHYVVRVDEGDTITWHDDGSHRYTTPALDPGTHVVIASAVDRAGNDLVASIPVTITALGAPAITDISTFHGQDGLPIIHGTSTYPNSVVALQIQTGEGDAYAIKLSTDASGSFTYVPEQKLNQGVYLIWAVITDSRGATSASSNRMSIIVGPTLSARIGTSILNALWLVIPIAAMGWYVLGQIGKLREELKKITKTKHHI